MEWIKLSPKTYLLMQCPGSLCVRADKELGQTKGKAQISYCLQTPALRSAKLRVPAAGREPVPRVQQTGEAQQTPAAERL